MDPISAGLAVAGLGLSLFGGFGVANEAKRQAQVQGQIASDERDINAQKQQQMQLEGRRSTMEQYRNAQRLRAQATAAATNQGASFGTGLQGGLAQVSDQSNLNQQSISQNQQIGQNIFGINNDISNKKMQLASISSSMAQDQAWGSLGGSLVKNAGTIGGLTKDVSAGFGTISSFFSPGSLSGGLV